MSKKNNKNKIEENKTPEKVENKKEETIKENVNGTLKIEKVEDEKSKKEDTVKKDKENDEIKSNTKSSEKSDKTDKSDEKDEVKANKNNTKNNQEDNMKENSNNEEIEDEEDDDDEERLEETEGYKNASFKEKLSLKFRKRLITNGIHTLVLVALLLMAFFGVNKWAKSRDIAQIDVTSQKLYSLTDVSKKQLSKLEKDLNIYIYGYDESNNYVTFIKQYAAFNNHIHYEIVTESTNYDIITKYELNNYGESSIAVVCGEKYKVLHPDYDFQDYNTYDDTTEEAITNAILNVTTDDPIKVYFTTGNGEYSGSEITGLVYALEDKVYQCDGINLLTVTEIPEDCDILTIFGIRNDITESGAEVLKSYINRGGNIFFAMTKISEESMPNLQSVLDLYGVSVKYGMLYENDSRNSFVYGNTRYQNILVPNLSYSSEVSANVSNSVIVPWAQGLTINEVNEENVEVVNIPILVSSTNCYNITDLNATQLDLSGLEAGEEVIGAEFERIITSKNEETGEESSTSSRIVVFGGCGFLTDYFSFDGLTLTPISYSGNYNIAQNAFASLAEQKDLISARKANTNRQTFEITVRQDRIVKTIIFGVPVLIIILGIVVWNIRKRKR